MTDWYRELEIYSLDEILEYNDIVPAEALSIIEENSGELKVPAVPVDDVQT